MMKIGLIVHQQHFARLQRSFEQHGRSVREHLRHAACDVRKREFKRT